MLLLFVLFAALVYFLLKKPKWKNPPPGPKGIPWLGNIFQLDKHNHFTFAKWAKEYGPIFKIDLATLKMVVISDHKMVKEIFSDSTFSGRMDLKDFDIIMDGKVHGVVNTEGEHWEELRRFTLRQLRDFGFGKNSMEESIMLEVNELIEGLKKDEGKPLENIKSRFLLAVVNGLWFLSTSIRHKQDDEELINMTENIHKAFESVQEGGGLMVFMPWLAKLLPVWSGYDGVRRELLNMGNYARKPMEDHKKTIQEDYDRDFTDVFLKEIKKTSNPNSAFSGKFGEDNLVGTLSDLFFAGTDTTSSTLSWMMLYLTRIPGVQEKFLKEIEAITGNTRTVSVADRPNMPYTEALIAETLRYSCIVPQGVGHRALKDQEFKGYLIPKDTIITANVFHIHFDPKIWGDPTQFRPERFLSPDGKTFRKHDALIAFSTGRRQCLGETLARDSLFLFSTNIVQRFKIEFDNNGPDHGFDSKLTFVLTPKPFNLIFKDRMA